jgi:tRNA pseudouridine13 synthase
LREEQIKISDFKLKSLKNMKCSGGFRKAKLIPKGFEWEIEKDEINEGKNKIIIKFTLPSGSYATVVLGEVMKNDV